MNSSHFRPQRKNTNLTQIIRNYVLCEPNNRHHFIEISFNNETLSPKTHDENHQRLPVPPETKSWKHSATEHGHSNIIVYGSQGTTMNGNSNGGKAKRVFAWRRRRTIWRPMKTCGSSNALKKKNIGTIQRETTR